MPTNLKLKTKKKLLDTSAIIALWKKEPGFEVVENIIASSAVSSVNLSELVGVLSRSGIPENEIDKIITDIVPEIIPFSEELAVKTGKLSLIAKEYGLSLGDKACIATGEHYQMEIYTTDKIWSKLSEQTNAKITIIR